MSAFDLSHAWLDVDPQNRGEGYPTEIVGTGPMLAFLRQTSTGILHDFDADTHITEPIAYWVVAVGGVRREVFITPYGARHSVAVPPQGPGCRAAVPIPPHPERTDHP